MPALDQTQIAAYHRDGYIIARQFFDAEETGLLRRAALEDNEIDQRSFGRDDGEGGTVHLAVWNHPGDSLYGMFARSARTVDSMEALLGGEVYHYHSKMILKEANVGGAWAWHQDYGYWYHNGCLYPQMASVSIAVDPATRENGCMQILKGSHHMGRVEHVLKGEQTGADLEVVEAARSRLELVHCEMEPGDALFFHCNALHCSDQNRSDDPRWSLICCYNTAANDPFKTSHHPNYTPLSKVADSTIVETGVRRFAENDEAWLDAGQAMDARRQQLAEQQQQQQ
jgi:ectoine hydroxylase